MNTGNRLITALFAALLVVASAAPADARTPVPKAPVASVQAGKTQLVRTPVARIQAARAPAAKALLRCDVNRDGKVTAQDLVLIAHALNQPASGPDDLRDADRDGRITSMDVRMCTPGCAKQGDRCPWAPANTAPVANAGLDQTVFTGVTVTLDGSGSSDADGDPLTYRWRLLARPSGSAAVLSSTSAVRPTFVADQPGRYEAELVVNDGSVDSAPDTVVVNTEDRNTAPVASAGPDRNAFVGVEVQLDGSGSSDVDGDALSFAWQLVSRPTGSTATLSGANTVQPRFTPDRRGLFVVRLTVDDGRGSTSSDEVTVSTESTDRPPVADAGPDQLVQPGQFVSLDGTGSADPDLDPITSYSWSFVALPEGSLATLNGATTSTPSFTADRRGDFVVQLVVTANGIAGAPDTVIVTTENVRPVADAGPDRSASVGDTVSLDGSASSDANDDPLAFFWSFLSRPAGSAATLNDALTPFASFLADVAGPFVLQLIVNDGLLDSVPDSAIVTIDAPANRPPTAFNDAATTAEGASILIDVLANDTDPDGDTLAITGVSQPAAGTTAVEDDRVRFTPAAGFSGQTSFTYSISDGNGGDSSATVTVTVSPLPTLSIADASVDEGDAGTKTLSFVVTLSAASATTVTVDFVTADGTATAGSDYQAAGGTLNFAPGVTSQNVTVTINGDTLHETDETFTVTLSNAAGARVTDGSATGSILNDDARPSLRIADVSLAEGNGGTTSFKFTLTLSVVSGLPATVDFSTANGTAIQPADYSRVSSSVTVPAGELTGTITVAVVGDTEVEPDETFLVNLASPRNVLIADAQAVGTILNDD